MPYKLTISVEKDANNEVVIWSSGPSGDEIEFVVVPGQTQTILCNNDEKITLIEEKLGYGELIEETNKTTSTWR